MRLGDSEKRAAEWSREVADFYKEQEWKRIRYQQNFLEHLEHIFSYCND